MNLKNKILNKSLFILSLSFLPLVSFAVTEPTIKDVIITITQIIGNLVPLLLGVALIIFLWGVILYVISDSETDKKKSIMYITNGVIALFVMVSVWGLVEIIDSFFAAGSGGKSLFLPRGR